MFYFEIFIYCYFKNISINLFVKKKVNNLIGFYELLILDISNICFIICWLIDYKGIIRVNFY